MATATRERLHRLIDELPEERLAAVEAAIDDAVAPGGLEIRRVPATVLNELSGLVAWGGDALEDSEALYDE